MKLYAILLASLSGLSLLFSCNQADDSQVKDIPMTEFSETYVADGLKTTTAYLDEASGLVKLGRCVPVSAFCDRTKEHLVLREIQENEYVTILAKRWVLLKGDNELNGINPEFVLSEESFESLSREYTTTLPDGTEVTRPGLIGQAELQGNARAVELYSIVQERARAIWAIRKFLRADGNLSKPLHVDSDSAFSLDEEKPTSRVEDVLFPFNFVKDLTGHDRDGWRTDVRGSFSYKLLPINSKADVGTYPCGKEIHSNYGVVGSDELMFIAPWLAGQDAELVKKPILLVNGKTYSIDWDGYQMAEYDDYVGDEDTRYALCKGYIEGPYTLDYVAQ